MKEKGQVVVLLLLVMLVAMAIGLSTISRSNVEVSTSRKSEDSSRAFSAAEAGIEKALGLNSDNIGGTPTQVSPFPLDNLAGSTVTTTGLLPDSDKALEYPAFGKESFAQLWLVNPNDITTPVYTRPFFYIYFGNPDTTKYTPPTGNEQDKPAIEVNVTYWNDTERKYQTSSQYFDTFTVPGVRSSGFDSCTPPVIPPETLTNNNTVKSKFYCQAKIELPPSITRPVMVRVRFLYTNISHPLAIEPAPGSGGFPKQVNIYRASGTSGATKRTLEVFQQKDVMPGIFDYALFSATGVEKH